MDWFALFGYPRIFLSDNGTHFRNTLVAELVRRTRLEKHHFTIPYCATGRSSVERVNLDIVNLLTILLAETDRPTSEWPHYTPVLEDVCNSYESKTTANYSARKVMVGLARTNPVDRALESKDPDERIVFIKDTKELINVNIHKREIQRHIATLAESLEAIHAEVDKATEKRRAENRKQQDKRIKHVRVTTLGVGDFCLRAAVKRVDKTTSKIHVNWLGPYRILGEPETNIYEVQSLRDENEIFEMHATRIKPYLHGADCLETELLSEHLAAEASRRTPIDKILDVRWESGSDPHYVFMVSWRGFSPLENSWEPLEGLYEDVPQMIQDFVRRMPDSKMKDELKSSLSVFKQAHVVRR